LAVVPAWQTLPHFADLLLDDVKVVQEPLARGSHVYVMVGGAGEAGVRGVQDPPRLVEASEEARSRPPAAGSGQALPGRHRPGAIREVLGAEQLAADRTAEQLVGGVRAAGEEAGQARRRRCGSDGRA